MAEKNTIKFISKIENTWIKERLAGGLSCFILLSLVFLKRLKRTNFTFSSSINVNKLKQSRKNALTEKCRPSQEC